MNKDVIRKIYDAMSKEYDMAEDFNTFSQDIQNKDVARRVYDAMYDRYRMEEDFEEFYKDLSSTPIVDGVKATENGSVVVDEPQDSLVQRIGKVVQGVSSPSALTPTNIATPDAPELTQEEKDQRAAMRQRLQEDGTIDRMKESKKEARRDKLRAFGSMLGSTPQVTSFGVSTNVFDSTDEQLADVGQALDAGTEYRQNKLLQEKLDVALDMARAGENQDGLRGVENFGLGLWDSATRLSTWDFGASDIVNNLTLQQIVEKWENDPSSLTATEQKVLEGIGMATAVQDLYSDQVGIGYNVGQSLPESASFMMGMALNPASGLGKSLARNAVRTYGRNSIAKNLARIGGDIAETAIMTATTGAGRVAADALERINGSSTYEIGDNGVIMYGGQKDQETVGDAVLKAIGSSFIENYSEALGEYFDPLLGMSRKVAAGGLRKMHLDKWADALSDVQPSQMTASIRALREKAKFGGILGEIMEEEVGMALNTLFVGDNQWSDFVDLETQLTTVLSCAIMSGTLNGVEQVSSVAARRGMEKNAKNAEQEALYRFGSKKFDPLREAIDQSSPEGMVDVLRDVYMSQEYTVGQKRALAEYAAARLQLQYYNAADAKARRQVNKTQQELLDAQEAGLNAQLPQFYNIARAAQNAEEDLLDYEGDYNLIDIIRSCVNKPEEMERILGDLPQSEARLVSNYIYSRARMDGAYQGRSNRAEDYVDDFAYALEPAVVTDAEGNRTITTALLGDRSVYVLDNNGDLAHIMRPDGSKTLIKASELTNITTSSAEEVIDQYRDMYTSEYNAETENAFEHHPKTQSPQVGLQLQSPEGEVVITAVNDNMVEIVPAVYKDGSVQPKEGAEPRTITVDDAYAWQDDYYQGLDDAAAATASQPTIDNVSAETAENESTPTEEIEQSVSEEVTNGQNGDTVGGSPVALSYLLEGGQGSIENAGYFLHGVAAAFPSITNEIEAIRNSMDSAVLGMRPMDFVSSGALEIDAIRDLVLQTYGDEGVAIYNELLANASGFVPKVGAALGQRIESLAETVSQPTETESVAPAAPQTARERVPKDDKGNPIYEQTDADTAWDAIVEETEGDTEMAQRVAVDMLADKKSALAKLQNGKPKKGATVAEKIANEKVHQAAIAQAQSDVAQWEAIVGTEARRREAAMSEADRYAAEMEQKSINEGLAALGEPQSLEEYVLGQLAGGAYKLRWSDKENGTKGFGSHTGLSTEEMKARLSMIDNKNGLTPEEIAHSIVENMDASFGEVDVMDVTNMVIDAVSTHASRRAMINGMVESRAELLRQQVRAEQEAKDAWYMEQYHATEEELAAYSEYLAEITEEIIADDANYEERFNTFAELIADEYDNQGTDADIRSSADQGEGLASDREGSSSVGEGEETDRQGAVLGDAPRFAEAEDGRAGSSVSAESDVDAEAEEWAEATIQRIRELEDEIANIEYVISEFEAGERSYIVDAEITALEDRLKDAIAERDGLLSLAEENNEGADFKSRQKKGTPAGVRVLDGKSKRASEEYARRTGWTEELDDVQLEIVDHLRGLTDEELKDFRGHVVDAIANGEDVEQHQYILNTIEKYRQSGERGYVQRDSGILPRQDVSLDKIEELFMEYNRDENLAILFDRLRPLIEKINPRFIFDIIRDADGNVADKVVGDYSLKDNLIRINYHSLYSGYQTEQEKASTIVHEMIHAITQYAIDANERGDKTLPKNVLEAAKSLVNIYNQIKDNEIFNTTEVDEEGNIIRDYGVKDVHEMISELANPEFREKLKQIDVKGKNAWERIIDAIARFINQFKDIYDTTAYGKAVRALDTLMDNFNLDAYEQSMVMSDGQVLCNIRTYREFGRDRLQAYVGDKVAEGILSAEDGADIIQQMDDIYEAVQKYTDVYVPFGNWSETEVVMKDGRPVFSVVKTNGDYKMNLDFSLVCKKRRTLDAVFDELIKRGAIENVSLEQVDIARINDIIRDHAFEVACSLCFVDAKRFRIAEVADDFCKMYNELVDKNDKQLQSIVNKTKKNTVRKKIAQLLLDEPSNRIKLSRENFMSAKGFDDMKVNAEEIMKLYNAKKGTGGPKASSADVQYHNDVLDKNWTPEAAYSVGGVRLQSFSDYVPRLVFDYIQMIADLSAKQLPVHAYTKEELFVRQFGLTGIKINMSLVPSYRADGVAAGLDKDGNYVWEQGQTFDYAEAVEIQNAEGYRENCGTIAVGVSDEHISKMLDDENIRMVIPYHKSGINKKVAVHNHIDKFTDYTNEQSTRDAKGKKLTKEMLKDEPNFNENLRKLGDPRAAAQAYLDWCDSKGYMPKFDKWRNHPNYYKLLEDFTTIIPSESGEQVVPQRGVTMTFPTSESAFGSLEGLIARGLDEDAVLEGRREKEVPVIADEVESELLRFRDGAPFFSNAERAVENIKQQKATPEQWLAMIKKDGGLKAGEDKWMGLSDWLNEQKEKGVKSMTKDEVLAFIRENQIEIEEVEYTDDYSQREKEYSKAIADVIGQPVGEAMYGRYHREGYTLSINGPMRDVKATEKMLSEKYGIDIKSLNDKLWEMVSDVKVPNKIDATRRRYTTEGLDNNKEIAFVVPSIESWNRRDEIHFGDAGDGRAVAWVRFGETIDEDGNRVLVIDEVQSKRHDEGRAKGYKDAKVEAGLSSLTKKQQSAIDAYYKRLRELRSKNGLDIVTDEQQEEWRQSDGELSELYDTYLTAHEERRRFIEENNDALRQGEIPDAPFDKNYHELVMKRMLRYAAENGFDKVAWTKGKQQAERYGLSTKVSEIAVRANNKGTYNVVIEDMNGSELMDYRGSGKEMTSEELSALVGKELSSKLIEGARRSQGLEWSGKGYNPEFYTIRGVDLSIGGEDRNALYDEMIPRFMNKYTKKWGTKVGEVTLPNVEEAGRTMWSVDVTPEMRESVMQGQPMFREGMGAISDREVSYENDPIAKFQGKPRYYGKRAAAFAERERRRMENAAKEAAEMLGIEAEIITDASTLKGRKAKAKGWYDINNKKVVVVVPNHVSMGDAVRTVLHEGIAHHGLRELFGDGFDAMLDNVYNNVAPELKARIDAIAERTGVSTQVATEEYLASLAETTNFEEAQRLGWWQQIKRFFVDMLNKLAMPGLNLKEELTDNELRYLLWRSYQNLVDPNSYLKPLGYIDDVAKQKELKVGEYAEVQQKTPIAVDGRKLKSLKEWIKDTLDIFGSSAYTAEGASEILDILQMHDGGKGTPEETEAVNDIFDYYGQNERYDDPHVIRTFINALYAFANGEGVASEIKVAEMSEAAEWAAVTMQRIEELEAQAAQLENEIAEMEADRDADDASRYEMWEQQLDPLRKQMEDVYAELEGLYSLEAEAEEMSMASEDAIRYRLVDDPAEIDRLESEPTIKAYRAMQVINGELYPPMSAVVDGKLREPIALGQWEQSEERPDLADDNGRFKLDKGNKKSLKAAYNPYFHSSSTPLNDQFSEAQDRDNLVTVEVEVPVSEVDGTSRYKAEKAKDAVGTHKWKAGIIQGQLTGTREVFLTRWDKPVRIVPESEVADVIVEMFDGKDIVMPSNVVTPQLRKELEARGIAFVETDNQGKLVEGEHKGEHYSKVYGKKADGLRYREDSVSLPNMNEKAEAFANIYRKSLDGDFMLPTYAEDAIENALSQIGDDIRTEYGNDTQTFFQSIGQMQYNRLMNAISNEGYGYNIPYAESWREDYADEAKDMMDEMIAYWAKEKLQDAENIAKYIPINVLAAVKPKGNVYKMLSPDVVNVLHNVTGKTKEEIYEEYAHEGASMLTDEDFKTIEEDSRNAITAEVEREAAALGVPVRIARSVDELPDEDTRKRAVDGKLKGYYDPRTNEVVLYAPNTDDANDAKRTILHEIVGHKGLRQLIGEQRYDKAMLQLMYMLPAEVRDVVLRRAERHGWNAAIAMDEYLAEQAERDVQPTWWGKVNAKIRALLRNMGFNVKLTDADATYLLWRSRKKLQGDTAFDMATDAILKQAARKSAEADAWNEQAFKDAEMRDFESNALPSIRHRMGAGTNDYEKAVRTLGFKQAESWQDSMRSLLVFQQAIAKASGKDISDFENAYMYENRMSSANLMEMEQYRHMVYNPLLKAIHELEQMGASRESIINYLFAKSGLERNEVFARRDAKKHAEGDAAKEQQLYDKYRQKDYAGLTALTRGDAQIAALVDDYSKKKTEYERLEQNKKRGVTVSDADLKAAKKEMDDARKAMITAIEAEAQRMVDEFEAQHNTDNLWDKIRNCTHTTLNISHDAGVMSDEVYNELWNQFQYYIPLRGFAETTAEDVYLYLGGSDSPYNAPIKTAYGRTSLADDPIATIGNMAESAIVEANRNRLKQRFLYMVERHNTDLASISDVWLEYDDVNDEWHTVFAQIPDDATPSEAKRLQQEFEDRMKTLAEQNPGKYANASQQPNIPYRVVKKGDRQEHHVIVKRNGKDVVITINGNPRVAQAINGLTNPEQNNGPVQRIVNWVNRNLSANFTMRNPAFMVSNFVRDGFYTNSMVWVKENPAYARQYNKNWAICTAQIASLVSRYKRYEKGDTSALDMNNDMDRMFYEFMINGGETGYTVIKSVEDYKGLISGEMKKMEAGAMGTARRVADTIGNVVDTFGRWAEDTSRFAAYMTSRQLGRTITKSIWDAKEISVNFNKKGSGNRMMGKFEQGNRLNYVLSNMSQLGRNLYVFWNAGMQGLNNFSKAAKKSPAKFTAMAGTYFTLGVIVAAAFSGDDDDDDYYNLPEYVRRNNICFKIGKGKYATLPLPIEIRAIYGLGELAYSYLSGREGLTHGEAVTKTIQQMTQIMPIDMMADGGGAMALVPSAAKPVVEVIHNVDWTGRPIYKEKTPWNQNDPTWTLAFKSTSPELVQMSRLVNEWTNKNTADGLERPYNRGWADNRYLNNPAVWEHIAEGYLGGMATMFNQTKKTLMMPFNEDLREVRNVPITSRFIKDAGKEGRSYAARNEYYDAKNIMDSWKNEMSKAKKEVLDESLTDEQRLKAAKLRSSLEQQYTEAAERWKVLDRQRKAFEEAYKSDQSEENRQALDDVMMQMATLVEAYRD